MKKRKTIDYEDVVRQTRAAVACLGGEATPEQIRHYFRTHGMKDYIKVWRVAVDHMGVTLRAEKGRDGRYHEKYVLS